MKDLVTRLSSVVVLAGCLAAPAPVMAGEFSVNPVRVDLGPSVRSSAVTVRNEGTIPLSFQVAGMSWQQDGAGKDVYTPSPDLVFFPRILSIDPGQEAVVRVGIKIPANAVEQTYRLFIEEMPTNVPPPESKGAQINFLIRFGAPIFVAPVRAEDRLDVEKLTLAEGTLAVSARNAGNRHVLLKGIRVRGFDANGATVHEISLADRYILAGVTKSYATVIPPEKCAALASVEVEFNTETVTGRRKQDVTRSLCAR